MKHIQNLLFISISVFFLASCSKENDGQANSETILGKWTFINLIEKNKKDGKTETTNYTSISTLEFLSNGKVIAKIDENENGRIDQYETDTSTYKVESIKLTFGGSVNEIYTIKTLTSTNLTFQFIDNEWEDTYNLKR